MSRPLLKHHQRRHAFAEMLVDTHAGQRPSAAAQQVQAALDRRRSPHVHQRAGQVNQIRADFRAQCAILRTPVGRHGPHHFTRVPRSRRPSPPYRPSAPLQAPSAAAAPIPVPRPSAPFQRCSTGSRWSSELNAGCAAGATWTADPVRSISNGVMPARAARRTRPSANRRRRRTRLAELQYWLTHRITLHKSIRQAHLCLSGYFDKRCLLLFCEQTHQSPCAQLSLYRIPGR